MYRTGRNGTSHIVSGHPLLRAEGGRDARGEQELAAGDGWQVTSPSYYLPPSSSSSPLLPLLIPPHFFLLLPYLLPSASAWFHVVVVLRLDTVLSKELMETLNQTGSLRSNRKATGQGQEDEVEAKLEMPFQVGKNIPCAFLLLLPSPHPCFPATSSFDWLAQASVAASSDTSPGCCCGDTVFSPRQDGKSSNETAGLVVFYRLFCSRCLRPRPCPSPRSHSFCLSLISHVGAG
eukprot:158125-Hanusia_phi.AAC.2